MEKDCFTNDGSGKKVAKEFGNVGRKVEKVSYEEIIQWTIVGKCLNEKKNFQNKLKNLAKI